jgi:hypothetical protein
MNDSGNIYEEHTISERPGMFHSAWLNKDNSLLFSGVIYKNINEKYLYLYKTKILIDGVRDNSYSRFNIYPNPATDMLNINVNGIFTEPVSISIFNSLGVEVYSGVFNNSSKSAIEINTYELLPGMYFCRVIMGKYINTKKFLILK